MVSGGTDLAVPRDGVEALPACVIVSLTPGEVPVSRRGLETKVRGARGWVELTVVLFIGAALLGLIGGDLVGMQGRMAVRFAQSRLLSLHGQSRDLAVERGIPMRFVADPSTQTVTIEEGCSGNGRVLESRDFNLSYRVDMYTGGEVLELCMTPRGYADPAWSSFTDTGRVTFLRAGHTSSVVFSPLGQLAEK